MSLVFLELLFDLALCALMAAPVEFGIFFEAVAPGFPALGWEFVNHVALFIEDVGRLAENKTKNFRKHRGTIANSP